MKWLTRKWPSGGTRIQAAKPIKKPIKPSSASFQMPCIGSLKQKEANTPVNAPATIARNA
jgi:hypothetical protein